MHTCMSRMNVSVRCILLVPVLIEYTCEQLTSILEHIFRHIGTMSRKRDNSCDLSSLLCAQSLSSSSNNSEKTRNLRVERSEDQADQADSGYEHATNHLGEDTIVSRREQRTTAKIPMDTRIMSGA